MIEPEDAGDPWIAWLHDHQPLAMAQGWGLWESWSEIRLQKVDDPEPGMVQLHSDSDAWTHVFRSAATDATCNAALRFLARHNPRELIAWASTRSLSAEVQAIVVTAHLCSGEQV